MSEARVRHLTVYLMKADAGPPRECVREQHRGRTLNPRRTSGITGVLYLQEPRTRAPSWAAFVRDGVPDLPDRWNTTNSAVLFVQASGRWFAITFGYGRAMINPDCFVRDFGLRVTLNRVHESDLRSVDAKTVEELTLHTRRQLSRGSRFETFGLNVAQDLVRAVTGKPTDPNFASALTGADALAFSAKLRFEDLGAKCSELLAAYEDTAYRRRYKFIDHLRAVGDPSLRSTLDGLLVEDLRAGRTQKLHVAPPEVVEWDEIAGFVYEHDDEGAEPRPDLDPDEFRGSVADPAAIEADDLRRWRLSVVPSDGGDPVARWRMYDCLAYEAAHDGRVFVLSGGDWFEIDRSFAAKVRRRVKHQIPECTLELPPAGKDQPEGEYNEAAAGELGCVLLDADEVDRVEVCDLFTADGRFIHVKRKTRSSTLSHLFNQGVVSADRFAGDPGFRKGAREKVARQQKKLAMLFPDARPNVPEYEVVYAIITRATRDWPLSLPFFSLLSLSNAADRLERMGFKVSLARIDVN